MNKNDIIRKLCSRKLWAAIAEFVTALLIVLRQDATEAEQIGGLIMLGAAPIAYMFAEGWADAGNTGTLQLTVQQDEKPPAED